MRRIFRLEAAGLASLALMALAASPAAADLRVIESNVPAYKVEAVLPNSTVFDLKAGDRVKVLVLPGNLTRVFEGKGLHSLEPKGGARSVSKKKKEE
jgi:hypothetical protein